MPSLIIPNVYKQRAIALCLLLFSSCSSPQCRQWEIHEIITKRPCFNGSRLILGPDSATSNLELEIVKNNSGLRIFINLLIFEAPPCKENPNLTKVEIIFANEEPKIIYPHLFEGGQRLLLNEEDATQILQYLNDGCTFTIKIGRSKITVIPNNFENQIKKIA